MSQSWFIKLCWWLCEKTNHLWVSKGWIYDGFYHRDCKLCGRIISAPIKEKNT